MKIIADTNIFLAAVLEEPEKERIVQMTEGHELVAPDILPFEVGNALTSLLKKKVLKPDEILPVWNAFQSIPAELCRIDIPAALKIAVECGLYAYDAYFLACAKHLRAPLLTLDRRMITAARSVGIQILE
jgi:predicted nucleic acid-binding protein